MRASAKSGPRLSVRPHVRFLPQMCLGGDPPVRYYACFFVPAWNRKKPIKNAGESTGAARHLSTSVSRARHRDRTKTGVVLRVSISTRLARRMETALSRASATARREKSMRFQSLRALIPIRPCPTASRLVRNNWAGIEGASEYQSVGYTGDGRTKITGDRGAGPQPVAYTARPQPMTATVR